LRRGAFEGKENILTRVINNRGETKVGCTTNLPFIPKKKKQAERKRNLQKSSSKKRGVQVQKQKNAPPKEKSGDGGVPSSIELVRGEAN